MAPGSGLSHRRPLPKTSRGSGIRLLRVRRAMGSAPGQRTYVRCGDSTACSRSCQAGIGGRARWGAEQRGRAPTRDAPTGGGWIPAGAGMTVSGILGFDNPRWLRGGPSSQSSPGGRRGKTSRPHPCLSPAGGLRTQGSRGLRGRWRTHPRRAPPTRLAARALSQSPPEGERFGGALPEGGGQRERASRDSPLREGEKRQDLPPSPPSAKMEAAPRPTGAPLP